MTASKRLNTFANRIAPHLLAGLAGVCLLGTFVYFLQDLAVLPRDFDEYVYYNSVRLFYETNSLQAPDASSEDTSVIFKANWYGAAYHLIYGLPAKILGPDGFNFFLIHFGVIVLTASLLYWRIKKRTTASFLVFIWLALNISIPMAYTFYPETIHMVFGVTLTCLVVRLAQQRTAGESLQSWRSVYVAVVFVAVLLRPTWAVWIVALLPLAAGRRGYIVATATVLACWAWTIVYVKLFCAPLQVAAGPLIDNLLHLDLSVFCSNIFSRTWENLCALLLEAPVNGKSAQEYLGVWFKVLVFNPFLILKVYLCAMIGINIFYVVKQRQRLDIMILLISGSYILMLLAMYTTKSDYFVRMIMPVLLLLSAGLLHTRRPWLRTIVAIVGVYVLFLSVLVAKYYIDQRRDVARQFNTTYKAGVEQLQRIVAVLPADRAAVIQTLYYDDFPYPYQIFAGARPVSTHGREPIMYSMSPHRRELTAAELFPRHGRLEIDYVLTTYALDCDHLELVLQTPHFRLYRDHRLDLVTDP
jgi:hypothetical protein